MISDEQLREHFERQYAQGGESADIARAALDLFDRADSAEDELAKLPDQIGDVRQAAREIDQFDALKVWAERDATFKGFGDLDDETLERFARAYDKHETESFALQELCVEAGLLDKNDFETNPIPLIRMFLPIEGD